MKPSCQQSQKRPDNFKNPVYGRLRIERYNWNAYNRKRKYGVGTVIGQFEEDDNLLKNVKDSQASICLDDYIPGTVQRITLDQFDKSRLLLVYRVLVDDGYLHRVRIYDIEKLECNLTPPFSKDMLKRQLFLNRLLEPQYFLNKDSNVTKRSYYKFEEDFVISENTKITSINLYAGDTITYSRLPDFYQFRVLKRKMVDGQMVWAHEKNGPFIYKQ